MLIGQTVGPFLIDSELGSGAMGTVYKAQFNKDSGRVVAVALKVVSLGLLGNEGAMARFDREAAILKQLKHPHIVRLLATGRYQKTPFIAMEFVDGESLEKTLLRRKRLDWDEVVSYGKQLCDALQHAHDKGIVHRDLKPSNLMVTADGTLKLTDFGIAKDTDLTALTGLNSTIGTAAYMSPEQCRGDKTLGPKSDLYSLGCCLYELITGIKPFTAESTVDLFLKHCNETPTRPRRIAPETPVWLDNLVMFCLEKTKESRPLDAATVGRMLGEIEEKVRTNQSVGEEVANARRVDRPVGQVADVDRAAARQMRNTGGKKKKKKKPQKPKVPLKLMIFALVPVLLLLGYAGYSLLPPGKPPETAEQVYERLAMQPGEPLERIDAAKAFIARFPGTPSAEQARGLIREAMTDQTEAALMRQYTTNLRFPAQYGEEAYQLAIQAFDAETAGNLIASADLWRQCKAKCPAGPADGTLPEENQIPAVGLGWVAERHMRVTRTELPALRKRIETKIAEDDVYELDPAFDSSDPDSLVARAIKVERLGDRTKAQSVWERLASATKGENAKLVYKLLAEQQVAANRLSQVPTPADRAAPIAKQLTAAEESLSTATNHAVAERKLRNLCRVVASAYSEEPDPAFVELVAQARKLLEQYPKS